MTAEQLCVAWCVVVWAAVAVLLIGIVRTDLRSRRIPNGAVAALVVAWVVLQAGLLLFGSSADQLSEAARECGVPDWLMGLFEPAGVLEGALTAVVAVALLSLVAFLYERIGGKEAMGAGDVKLIGALALFAGPLRSIVALMVACVVALLAALVGRRRAFPFAPAIAVGLACAMLVTV